jgi:hypothetical protein
MAALDPLGVAFLAVSASANDKRAGSRERMPEDTAHEWFIVDERDVQ